VKVSGGIFRDMMIHDLDMARFLLADEPVEVHSVGSCLVDPEIGRAGDVDTAVVVMRTAAGTLCVIDNSRRAVYGYDQRIEAFGEKGMIAAGNPAPTTLTRATAGGVLSDKPPWFFLERYAEAYRAELDHFLDVLDGRASPLIDGRDGRAALVLADAAARSLAEGRPVKVGA
jgi:myo-inositol 2-dehydrogenase/D-chiro-inositol 1-dehydrogenase